MTCNHRWKKIRDIRTLIVRGANATRVSMCSLCGKVRAEPVVIGTAKMKPKWRKP